MKQPGKYALTGALAGLANGLFGSGGGLFLVPLFTGWAKLPQRKAFATSVAVILPLSLVSAAVYWFRGGLDVSAAWPYLLGEESMEALLEYRQTDVCYGGVRAVLAL